jgi:hypothetical protein
LPWSTWAMMATLRRFMALLLAYVRSAILASRPDLQGTRSNISGSMGSLFPKKEARPKRPGTWIRCGAIYSENAKKQWVVWHLVNRISPG